MKLATLKDGTRDGRLIVVTRDLSKYVLATDVATTMQAALDDWERAEPALKSLAEKLESGSLEALPLAMDELRAPLPRAYEWVDGSAYINHIVLVRKARNAEPPETLETDPLVYQGGSGVLLSPLEDIVLPNPEWGLDFEAEICVILGDTPQGVTAENALDYVKLVTLANDITYRNLIPGELKKGFGFFNSKPATAFGPVAVTPDELGGAWKDGRVFLPLRSTHNGERAGAPEAGPEMHFSFADLIAHICKTRGFTAGTILGSGTISNSDESMGVSCLAERRMREIIDTGKPSTAFMKVGDTIAIEMLDEAGATIFGRIEQKVVAG